MVLLYVNHCFNPQGDGGREGHMVRANAVSHWGRNEDLISHPVSQHFAERIGPLTVGDEGSVGAVLLAGTHWNYCYLNVGQFFFYLWPHHFSQHKTLLLFFHFLTRIIKPSRKGWFY